MKIFTLVSLLLVSSIVSAGTAEDDIKMLESALAERFPNVEIKSVTSSQIDGLYQVIAGTQVVYMDNTGRYMLSGALMDLDTDENLTDLAKTGIRLQILSTLPEDQMLVYRPEKVDHVITVVTDVDCPYCRKLHSEMDDFLESNIEVRYIFMPFKGRNSYNKSVSIWCADDRNLAMDIAKAGGQVEKENCINPIRDHQKIARKLGITGTPAIILEDGELLPGYLSAEALLAKLNSKKHKQ